MQGIGRLHHPALALHSRVGRRPGKKMCGNAELNRSCALFNGSKVRNDAWMGEAQPENQSFPKSNRLPDDFIQLSLRIAAAESERASEMFPILQRQTVKLAGNENLQRRPFLHSAWIF